MLDSEVSKASRVDVDRDDYNSRITASRLSCTCVSEDIGVLKPAVSIGIANPPVILTVLKGRILDDVETPDRCCDRIHRLRGGRLDHYGSADSLSLRDHLSRESGAERGGSGLGSSDCFSAGRD